MVQTTIARPAPTSARRPPALLAGSAGPLLWRWLWAGGPARTARPPTVPVVAGALAALALVVVALAPPTGLAAGREPSNTSARQAAAPGEDQGDPTFLPEVSAGFDGMAKAGHWLTVRAVVANDGPPLSGELRLLTRAGGDVSVYTQPVELAARARRLVVFQVPGPAGAGEPRLTLVARGGDVVLSSRTVPVRVLGPNEFLVGVVSDDAVVPSGLGAVRRRGNPVAVAQLTPGDLPADPVVFEGLDALVVRQASSDRLTTEQRAALRTWIEQGGQLVVAGGPGWRRSIEGLDDLLPVEGLWTRQVKHLRAFLRYASAPPPEGDLLVTLGSPVEGARVLLAQESIPLIVERWLGLGRVTFVGPDPALEPFRSWPAAESLWQRILVGGRPGLPTVNGSSPSGPSIMTPVRSLLGEMLDLGLPAAGWVVAFLVGYVAVVGPGQYLLLRRLDRREWAWGGFPVLALGAAGLLLLGAHWLRGPEVRQASVSIARVAEGIHSAPVETYLGVVAPARGTYDLTLLDGRTPRPLGERRRGAADTLVTVEPGVGGSPARLPGLRLEGRALHVFQLRAYAPAPTPVFADLKTTNGRLEGMVRNVGPDRLEDAIVVASGEAIGLGDIAPGESRPVSLSLPTLRAAGAWQNGPPPWALPGARPGADHRRGLLSTLFQTPWGDGGGEASGGVTLLAWTAATGPRLGLGSDPAGPVPVTGSAGRLIQQALPIAYGAEQVVIPPGLLGRIVLDGAAQGRGDMTAFAARGPVVFQFDLPPGLALARIDRLSLHLALAGRSAATTAPSPRASLFRWADRTWVDVPLAGSGVANVGFGASFVDGGAIRVRIEPQGTEIQVEQLDLSLEGVRE